MLRYSDLITGRYSFEQISEVYEYSSKKVNFGFVQRNRRNKASNKNYKQVAKGELLWHFSQEISGQENW